jgi:hypothetical protein
MSFRGVAVFLTMLWALGAFGQLSSVALRLQSEPLQLLKSTQGKNAVMTYHPRGETESNWNIKFEVILRPGATAEVEARKDLTDAIKKKGQDRYSGVLLMGSRSNSSFYLDQVKTENGNIESSLTRYFAGPDGLVLYRWTRRLQRARIPADATTGHIEVMRFIDRERQRRADLITDLATKKEMPRQVKDDPMGMKTLPLKPRSRR